MFLRNRPFRRFSLVARSSQNMYLRSLDPADWYGNGGYQPVFHHLNAKREDIDPAEVCLLFSDQFFSFFLPFDKFAIGNAIFTNIQFVSIQSQTQQRVINLFAM